MIVWCTFQALPATSVAAIPVGLKDPGRVNIFNKGVQDLSAATVSAEFPQLRIPIIPIERLTSPFLVKFGVLTARRVNEIPALITPALELSVHLPCAVLRRLAGY
jgi:hypothetical protein